MDEYIKRKDVLQLLHGLGGCDAENEWDKGYDSAIAIAYTLVKEMPAADVSEVVYCGGCKYGVCENSDGWVWCNKWASASNVGRTCSEAEKREQTQ